MKRNRKTLFIFRRDLRLHDNTGLIKALIKSDEVLPCFIFDDVQIEAHPFLSLPGFRFMIDSITDLDTELRKHGSCLYLFRGKPEKIVSELSETEGIDCVMVNRDYTPFSIKRDERISEACNKENMAFQSYPDLLLNEPDEAAKKDGIPYKVFTPYFRNAFLINVNTPASLPDYNFSHASEKSETSSRAIMSEILGLSSPLKVMKGGRKNGLKILNRICDFSEYENKRDYPNLQMTTGLSAHLKFGTCSVREIYHSIKKALGSGIMEPGFPIIRQLYWRDFFTHIAYFFPQVFGHAFHEKYDNIKWENNETLFKAWCEGKTGFPIVDAGMRQLNETGFMHGRTRMICASFLVKDLHIDWRWGERYFATKLTDYDPCINNGNWQWAASTGCDSQPYFRIFNPWIQQKKYDKECLYIKKWLPELQFTHPQAIHNHEKINLQGYQKPIIDHRIASEQSKILFKL